MDESLNLLNDLLKTAQKEGADEADIVLSESRDTSVGCRNGKLENSGSAEQSSLSLRVFVGQRTATLSSSDLTPDILDTMVKQAISIAEKAPESEYTGLVDSKQLADIGDIEKLDLYDSSITDADALFETAQAMEEAALAVGNIEQTSGANAGAGERMTAICTSQGFSQLTKNTSFGRSCGAVAANESGKEVGNEFSWSLFLEDIDDAASIGRTAGERAAAKLNSGQISTGQFPVIFAPYVSSSLVSTFAELISGPAVTAGMTFLKDSLGSQIFANDIKIIDDPLMRRGLQSRAFDGEGVSCQRSALVDEGRLTGWMLNYASARELGMKLTGHSRPLGNGTSVSNLYLEAGKSSPEALMADIDFGFYVTDLLGHGSNHVTGDYSHGAAGFLIEKGEITRPVKGATIAGNLGDMYKNMTPASDLKFKNSVNAPTLRVDGMMVAGD